MKYGYRTILLGLFFSVFHINIGVFQILPAFLGWFMVANGINILYMESHNTNFRKAYYWTLSVAACSFLGFLTMITRNEAYYLNYLSNIIVILTFPFICYMMYGSIEALRSEGEDDEAEEITKILNIFMIIYIINAVIGCAVLSLGNQELSLVYIVIGFIQFLWLMYLVNRLKSMFTNYNEEE